MNRAIVVNAMLMLMLGATAWGAARQSTTGSAVSETSAAGTTSSVGKQTAEVPHGGTGTPLDTGRTLPTGATNLPLLAAIGLAALGGALAVRSIAKRTS
jgi:hypothetical protein